MATQVRGAARRAQLLHQLVELLLAEGFAHLTLDEIAARLKCSKSTLYTLATSKDQLVRAAVVQFFRDATERVEASLGGGTTARGRIRAYLEAVGEQLRPATAQFMVDLADSDVAREVYERNTAYAAGRVQGLISDGVASGEFRDVNAAFVADLVASTMVRIQSRSVLVSTGLDDAEAYRELAVFVTNGLTR